MLRNNFFISLFFGMCLIVFALESHSFDFQTYENIIKKRSQSLRILVPDIDITIEEQNGTVEVYYKNKKIRAYSPETSSDASSEKIISFFLNLEESLLFVERIQEQTEPRIEKISVIDALYEYPFIDQGGSKFIYISDKGTGNRNIFILDLSTYNEREIIIPQTGDYFPVLLQDELYFLKAVENGFSLVFYNLANDKMQTIRTGNITCLRTCSNELFFS